MTDQRIEGTKSYVWYMRRSGVSDLAAAHERLSALSHHWSVQVHRVHETPSSLVAFGLRGDERVVLKIVSRQHEEWDVGAVVTGFAGRGMVRALDHVPGAVLLEQLEPGTMLTELVEQGRDQEATDIVVGVVAEMCSTEPGVLGHASARQWAAAFERYPTDGIAVLPRGLVVTAHRLYVELCDTQGPTRLLHGDLQHYNILWDRHRGWLAIDPKGVVAELEFELGAVLRNPHGMPELYTAPAIRRRATHLAEGLALDLDRILAWTYAQAVLSAVWSVEDGETPSADAPILAFARAAQSLIA